MGMPAAQVQAGRAGCLLRGLPRPAGAPVRASQVQASRGGLAVTTTRLHLHRTAFGAVQVAPVRGRQGKWYSFRCLIRGSSSIILSLRGAST
jgi:hypothetical protein